MNQPHPPKKTDPKLENPKPPKKIPPKQTPKPSLSDVEQQRADWEGMGQPQSEP